MKQTIKGEVMLAFAAIIWGTAFIFQKMGMDHIGPMTFTFFRFGLGAVAMIPVVIVADKISQRREDPANDGMPGTPSNEPVFLEMLHDRTLLYGVLACGMANFVASALQQIGIVSTTAGKAGFLTAMEMFFVPFILVLLRRHVHGLTWLGVVVGIVGMYLLTMKEGFSMATGDLFCIGGAICFAVQILSIDHFVEKVDPIKLAFGEFVVTAVMSLICTLLFEEIIWADILACIWPILYTAILEVCAAFTLQMIGQQYAQPAIATIIMSFESVFAALSGAVFLDEVMTGREILGCVIMFAAFIIAEIPEMMDNNEG